ncbi:unnamed protein product [Rotaria sp. Silwood1]|nr:unnamed protein product [Rotaria sp. Silwood1]CAF1633336.1 unnamed protein product [Rotaria sp. Silwood1]CAF4848549.1 unnamed protein product [Rotaria sp. Silwood1]
MTEFKDNFMYINNMMNDFHVEYFKNVIMKSKRFLSLLLLTYNEKCNTNINEDLLIEQLNIVTKELNVYDIKFSPIVESYSNDFSCGTPHRLQSLEGGYLLEKQIFGTIKYNFWYDDSCCQLIFDKNTWLSSTNSCLFTSDILAKFECMSNENRKFRRNIENIQFFGMEHRINGLFTYE